MPPSVPPRPPSDLLLRVAGIGWLDDHRPLTPWSRLAVHAVASCLLGIVAIGAGGQFASALFAFVLAMVLVNIWNFMDGIDGIAALQDRKSTRLNSSH